MSKIGVGKRVPKKKPSCCTSCTSPSPADSNDDSPKRPAKVRRIDSEDHDQIILNTSKSVRHKKKIRYTKIKEEETEEEVSVSPSEWLSDLSVLQKMNTVDTPNASTFEILESHMTSFIALNDVDSSSLLSLVGKNAISISIINKIADLLNGAGSNNICFSFNYYLTDDTVVKQMIETRNCLDQLIIYLDIDMDEEGETYLAEFLDNNSTHYTLAVFDFESLTLIYADTLGWNIPVMFVSNLKGLLASMDYPTVFHTILCHTPNDLNDHACVTSCSPLYPIQSSNNISSLAVIICMVIASVHYDIFLTVVMGIQTAANSYLHYLQDFSSHSKFLRLVIGSWIVNNCVDFNYIASCDELVRYQTGLVIPKQSGESKNARNSGKPHLENYLPIKADPGSENVILVDTKNTSAFGLDDYISCRPIVHFCKPNHLRLKLSLKDGRSLYKMFRCTGKNDRVAMRNIVEFTNSYKVIEWIKSKTFKNTTNISKYRLRKNKTCNIIDFPDDIQEYFIKNPELSFERKIMYLVLRVYIRGCSSITTKKFSCSAAGKNDRAAIKRINTYVKSKEFQDLVVTSAKLEQKITEEQLSYAEFEELIIREPLTHFIKDKSQLKLECQLWTGKKVYKAFSCTSAGKGDLTAMAAIKKFMTSKEATEWIRNKYEIKSPKKKSLKKKARVSRDDIWTPFGELSVGLEVKNFFETIEFDFRKRVVMAKGVNTFYEGNAIITENEKWGKTHRFDESYALDEATATEKGIYPAVTMYVTCSSKSPECKAQCGTLLKDFANTVIGSECPGCQMQLDFPDKECINCLSTSTPKWYSHASELYCSACYQYQQKHNEARPSELNIRNIQAGSRLYHPHFVCGWRLKLVIYSNNMSLWKLFKHKENAKFHNTKIQDIDRKPILSQLDSTISLPNAPAKCQKVIIRSRDSKSILCNRCISENTSPPFVCMSQTELIKHISSAHKIALINCATCWSVSGTLVNFENECQLQQHIQEHKSSNRFTADTSHDRDQDHAEATRQVELDEAVIALLEPSPM